MFQTELVERIKTHFMINNGGFFFYENRAVYEIIRKNVVEPDRTEVTIKWRMRFAFCLPQAMNTQSEYVILTGLHEWALMLRYLYIACFVIKLTL